MKTRENSLKLLVLTIDGLEPRYVEHWDDLHTLKLLIEEGAFGYIKSTLPPQTCPAFITIKTGCNPGRFGFYGLLKLKRGSYDVEPTYWHKCNIRDVWYILSDHGYRTGVINVPLGLPARRFLKNFKGFIFSFHWGLERVFCYPKSLANIYRKLGNPYLGKLIYGITEKERLANGLKLLKNYFKIAASLLHQKRRLDILFTGFDIDSLQHFIDDEELLHKAYLELDDLIAKLIKMVKPLNIIVVSDHGSRVAKGAFYINEWLIREGYLKLKREYRQKLQSLSPREVLTKILFKAGLNEIVYKLVRLELLKKLYRGMRSWCPYYPEATKIIDWKRTTAFSPVEGCIFINVSGKFPYGVVKEEEYEDIRNELIRGLKRELSSHGDYHIYVFRKEDVYKGPMFNEMPDIVFHSSSYQLSTQFFGSTFSPRILRSNIHSLYGTFIAWGSDVRSDVRVTKSTLEDVAPTILQLVGITPPEYMDGRVLMEILSNDF